MTARIAATLLGMLCAAMTLAGPCDKSPKNYFLHDAEPQAKAAGLDYTSALSKAFLRDKPSLVSLLTVTSKLDGSGAQTHAEVLWNLVQCWGDAAFAEVLSTQVQHVKSQVVEQLRYATEENQGIRSSYPKTFGASRKTSNSALHPTVGSGASRLPSVG